MGEAVWLDQQACLCRRQGGWTLQSRAQGAVRGQWGPLQQTVGSNRSHPKPAHGSHKTPAANPQVKSPRKAPAQYKYFFLPATNLAWADERPPEGLSRSPEHADSLLLLTTARLFLLWTDSSSFRRENNKQMRLKWKLKFDTSSEPICFQV